MKKGKKRLLEDNSKGLAQHENDVKHTKKRKKVEGAEEKGAAQDSQTPPKKEQKSDDQCAAPQETDGQSAPFSEEGRRSAQRAITELVVRLRKEGKTPREVELAKRELKQKLGSLRQPTSKANKKIEKWKEQQATEKEKIEQQKQERATRQHDVVVIPVVWRGRHDKDDVTRAAEDIKACIAQQNVDVWIDSRRQYTPGQKFAHWEHRGVMLRVEVGPKDVENGVCRVCRAKEAGDYQSVDRKTIKLPPHGARLLLLTLKEWGLDKLEITRRDGDSDEDGETTIPVAEAKATTENANSADNLEGNWIPRKSVDDDDGKTPKKKKGKKK